MQMNRTIVLMMMFLLLGAAFSLGAQSAAGRTFKVKVTAEQANLREKPDIGSGIVQQIPEGTVLEADRKEGEWFFVRYTLEDGGVIGGYIHESLVEVVEEGPAITPERATPASPSRPRQPAAERAAARSAGFRRSPVSSRFDLSLSAGGGSIAPRDLNDGAQGFADFNAASLGVSASGPVDPLHLLFLLGAELSYRVSPWISIGIGASYYRGANKSVVEYPDELASETLETRPGIRAVPVKLNVRFYPGEGFYIRGGLGLYSVKAAYLYRLERAESWEQWKGAATKRGVGVEAAFGGDWRIRRRTFLFVEAGFRMARFRGLTGQDVYRNSAKEFLTQEGTLYYFLEPGVDERSYPCLFVRATKPADARRADVNLSGMFITAGLRFRF